MRSLAQARQLTKCTSSLTFTEASASSLVHVTTRRKSAWQRFFYDEYAWSQHKALSSFFPTNTGAILECQRPLQQPIRRLGSLRDTGIFRLSPFSTPPKPFLERNRSPDEFPVDFQTKRQCEKDRLFFGLHVIWCVSVHFWTWWSIATLSLHTRPGRPAGVRAGTCEVRKTSKEAVLTSQHSLHGRHNRSSVIILMVFDRRFKAPDTTTWPYSQRKVTKACTTPLVPTWNTAIGQGHRRCGQKAPRWSYKQERAPTWQWPSHRLP